MKHADKNLPARAVEPQVEFKGYSMEELRYQRAMMALKKEFCKAKVLQSVDKMRPHKNPAKSSSPVATGFSVAAKVASKVFSNLNALDYVLMGISLFGTVRKGVRLIRGKK